MSADIVRLPQKRKQSGAALAEKNREDLIRTMVEAMKTAKFRGRKKTPLRRAHDVLTTLAAGCDTRAALPILLDITLAIGLIEKAAEEAQQPLR